MTFTKNQPNVEILKLKENKTPCSAPILFEVNDSRL